MEYDLEGKETKKERKGDGKIKRDCKTKGRFCLVDEKEITFMLLDDEKIHPSYDVGVWANTPFFAAALQDLFNEAWKSMDVVTVKN